MATELELLTEIRDLLQILAEPQIAERDRKLRKVLRESVRGEKGQKAVVAMDGTRTQREIVNQVGIDQGQLSRLVKSLVEVKLIPPGDGKPKLAIPVPANFFQNGETE